MDAPQPLDSLFQQKLFRIPDYQRGYAWQPEQLKDFWEDLVNLSGGRSHYTGVLTLKEIPAAEIRVSDKEFWLVEDHSYRLYHIVDGQQRLTTFVVFLQAFVNFIKALPEYEGVADNAIYITDSLSVADVQGKFLFRTKPTGDQFRTYKFGYTVDNPSYEFLRYKILGERGGGSLHETFYTLNLSNAKRYFTEQLRELYEQDGLAGLQAIYRKLTKRFLFNEYVIQEEFDVFVAFETMNNRGKQLSNLELLKNRLIYLTTLYSDEELDAADRKNLRDTINDAWKEVYHQLGRNKRQPLNDDDFLQAHWTMYFRYSRRNSWDYINFLLKEQFTPQKVHKKVERTVALEVPEERLAEADFDDPENQGEEVLGEAVIVASAQLRPHEISDFVHSLKESVVHWFASFYPHMADGLTEGERHWLDRLNRVGMTYFRPLIMAILKNEPDAAKRDEIFKRIERFIFVVFRMTSMRSNYRDTEFYAAARSLDRDEIDLDTIARRLEENASYLFNEDGSLRSSEFYNLIYKLMQSGSGYYGWGYLRYFLYEYELSLLDQSRQKKVGWSDLLKVGRDRISIEHIYPQTETAEWAEAFGAIEPETRRRHAASLGNMLLLSASINSSLQNDSFENKKTPKYDARGDKVRNGYSDGSHSEIEVAQERVWGPDQVRERGLKLLCFMEERWNFRFRDADKENLLFLASEDPT